MLKGLHCWDAFRKCHLTGRTITSGDVAAAAHLSGHAICREVGLCRAHAWSEAASIKRAGLQQHKTALLVVGVEHMCSCLHGHSKNRKR